MAEISELAYEGKGNGAITRSKDLISYCNKYGLTLHTAVKEINRRVERV